MTRYEKKMRSAIEVDPCLIEDFIGKTDDEIMESPIIRTYVQQLKHELYSHIEYVFYPLFVLDDKQMFIVAHFVLNKGPTTTCKNISVL